MAKKHKTRRSAQFLDQLLSSDTVTVAAVPVMAYVVTFAYRSAYLSTFMLPAELMTLSLAEVLVATAGLLGVAWALFSLANVFYTLVLSTVRSNAIARRLREGAPIYLYCAVIFVLFPDSVAMWAGGLIVLVVHTILAFLLPAVRYRGQRTFRDKIEADEARIASIDGHIISLWDKAVSVFGPKLYLALLFFAAVLMIAFLSGRSQALHQKEFRVASTSPEAVVLYIAGDKMICAPFDRSNKEIEPSFFALKMGEDPAIQFRLENVGPLRVRGSSVTPFGSPRLIPTPLPTSP